jgi:hypothetical protein
MRNLKNQIVNFTEMNGTQIENINVSEFIFLEQKIIEKNNLIRFDIFLHLVFICTIFISFFIVNKKFFLKLNYLRESKYIV